VKLTSRDNPKVKHWTKLASDGRYRRSKGRALIEGPHLVQAARQAGVEIHALLASENARPEDGAIILSQGILASIVETETPQGVAAEISIPSAKAVHGDCVFLEGVQDPGNVGAIIRSAAALGVKNVVLDGACADPWSPKALRAGMGGHFNLLVNAVGSLEEELARFAGRVLCTVPRGGAALAKADLSGTIAWIFGSEGQGVSEAMTKHADLKVSIPMADGGESLNVAAAAAICFYETFRQRGDS